KNAHGLNVHCAFFSIITINFPSELPVCNRSAPSKKPSSLGDLGSYSWEKVLMDSMSTALFSQE
ncbi:MAG: hypothetical protein ACX932_03195, partial [Gammaproteobacteria bacterium]